MRHDVKHELLPLGNEENVARVAHLAKHVLQFEHGVEWRVDDRDIEGEAERMRRHLGRRIRVARAKQLLVVEMPREAGDFDRPRGHAGAAGRQGGGDVRAPLRPVLVLRARQAQPL